MAMRARDVRTLRSCLSEAISCLHYHLMRNNASKPIRRLSSTSEKHPLEWENFTGKSAYEVLGVCQSSSFAEIKSSFRKLAKETHPDVAANLDNGSDASQPFLQILAAYEILSDSKKRAHYDAFLLSQKRATNNQNSSRNMYTTYKTNQSIVFTKESNVVEWLKWYRRTIDDIIAHNRIAEGSSYLDKLENELYCAIRSAYYGPHVRSMDLLPDCFEAEERSVQETSELLHLVSGRDLFGIVYVVDDSIKRLSHDCQNNFISIEKGADTCQEESLSDAYKDLELHVCGKLVATASRMRKCHCLDERNAIFEDHIHVFLLVDQWDSSNSVREQVSLGTITGLETSDEEGSCTVYDSNGTKTHMIMKHRTLLVKLMHWYRVGGEVSVCECRSSRARLPPSRYWLFQPRCNMHDIGGWYVETFGKDKKGRTVLSPRHWDSFDDFTEKRLHPAMYLMALAYRSLDLEEAQRRKWSILNFDLLARWYKRFF